MLETVRWLLSASRFIAAETSSGSATAKRFFDAPFGTRDRVKVWLVFGIDIIERTLVTQSF